MTNQISSPFDAPIIFFSSSFAFDTTQQARRPKTRSNTINRLRVIHRYSGGCICVVEKVVRSDRLISIISALVVKGIYSLNYIAIQLSY
ncbi:hypothetical protein O181_024227 [Austropuccinia psidii MF-1]|uniref:Uncharacterized protein n=1 Tax=Austropuccinia psidii MF-1 TaxID=1389203 RepID=A0A9Q3GYS2_9BASI|nr:hypothetical protein [Austropuccinia psidii MF-1]